MNRLAIVIPCYNEQEVLPTTFVRIRALLGQLMDEHRIASDSFCLFVDDGSRDRTWPLIEERAAADPAVCGLKLAGNAGHQNALLAGLEAAIRYADVTVTIDADLQDDEQVIRAMVDHYAEGADIVYGVRDDRTADTAFKRATAQGFYKVMRLMGAKTVYNHADFRLMSRRAVEALLAFGERNMFLRGVVPTIGFHTETVTYARKKREAGESKYPFKKMVGFALDGITSFSVTPIHIILWIGLIILLFSLIATVYSLVRHFTGQTVPGWTSLMVSVWFLGGLQLIAIGLIGEYIGKTYLETKHRPRYTVETILPPDRPIR